MTDSAASINNPDPGDYSPAEDRLYYLSADQVMRLDQVMRSTLTIRRYGRSFRQPLPLSPQPPALCPELRELVKRVRRRLNAYGVPVRDVRLCGSCASFVIGAGPNLVLSYNDLDLIFRVDLSYSGAFQSVKMAVFDFLRDLLSDSQAPVEAFVRKLVRVASTDRWSLISLGWPLEGAPAGSSDPHDLPLATSSVELKFVDRMRRQYEFTVDSFQIVLDPLLASYDRCHEIPNDPQSLMLVVESVSGSFAEAFGHLTGREIFTRSPEQIRGGGLLKYCKLLSDGYRVAPAGLPAQHLQKYMCSRFFIDFPDEARLRAKLRAYLADHFAAPGLQQNTYSRRALLDKRAGYLRLLHQVVASSTVCLMQRQRSSALRLIDELAGELLAASHSVSLEPFSSGAGGWTADRIVFGDSQFPWRRGETLSRTQQPPREGCCLVSTCCGRLTVGGVTAVSVHPADAAEL